MISRSVPELYALISPYVMELLQTAPKYGFCGIDIVFHDGRPVKIDKRYGISLKGESLDLEGKKPVPALLK
jgi:hypothetical protein